MGQRNVSLKLLDKKFQCLVCQHELFERNMAVLKAPGSMLANLGKTEVNATCLICEKCGFVHWFVPEKTLNASDT
jgi:transcription elongation factor Elf1